ncbi:hypothetical protein JCM33374_g1811 [Metschnikowia sp. JCM 33374]|nr:hypothetical protein JCM33374_g1811 [Metschnikowia sp. JCM 33374]
MKTFTPLILAISAQAARLPGFLGPRDEDNTWFTCPASIPETCTSSSISNTCCFESQNGVIVQTQYWDYKPSTGPVEEFTLRGLWPYQCDGTSVQYCDNSLNVNTDDVETIVGTQFDDQDLLDDMKKYWTSNDLTGSSLWAYEYNKHGSCIGTEHPQCWGDNFEPNENIYEYFRKAVALYASYPTFQYLKSAQIVPSSTQTYTYDQILEAIKSNVNGIVPLIKCDSNGALHQVGYYHHFIGPLIVQDYIQIDSLATTNCPSTGIKFLPKASS